MATRQNCSGCFLIASPYLTDGHFFRRVVLVIRHSPQGAFGVVINHPGPHRFSDVVQMSEPSWKASSAGIPAASEDQSNDSRESTVAARDQIFLGGPVRGPLMLLHSIAGIGDPCGGEETFPKPDPVATTLPSAEAESFASMSIQWSEVPAWVTADEDHLRLLARREDARLKFVVNYSGWGPGQLDQELEAGGWLIVAADPDSIFSADDELWRTLVQRAGHAILRDLSPGLPLPDAMRTHDPRLN